MSDKQVLQEGTVVNAFVIYKFIKLLVKPFNETKAFKLGIIDEKGNYLKKQKDLKSSEEREASNIFTRLVWNVKKIFNKIPAVRSKIGTLASALYLVREEAESIGANGDYVLDSITKYLEDNGLDVQQSLLNEAFSSEDDSISEGEYILKEQVDGEDVKITIEETIQPIDHIFKCPVYRISNDEINYTFTQSEIERI